MRLLTPATLTRVSMWPYWPMVFFTSRATSSGLATSQTSKPTACLPLDISCAVRAKVRSSRPAIMTLASRSANPSASARPMPRLAPATRTTWSATENNLSGIAVTPYCCKETMVASGRHVVACHTSCSSFRLLSRHHWRNADAGVGQHPAYFACEFDCTRLIAVDTKCIGFYDEIRSLVAFHFALFDHALHAHEGGLNVADHCIRLVTGRQAAIQLISAIGKYFAGGLQAGFFASPDLFASRKAEEHQLRIEVPHGACNGSGDRGVFRRHVVKRAMRLDMCQLSPAGPGECRQRAHMVHDHIVGFFG